MHKALIFGIGMICGVGVAAYYFIGVHTETIVAQGPVMPKTALGPPAPAPPTVASAPAVVPEPNVVFAPAPTESPAKATFASPSPAPVAGTGEPATKSTDSTAPAAAVQPLPPITPAEPVSLATRTPIGTASALPANVARPGDLIVPVDGIRPNQLSDTYHQRRDGNRPHEALDIMAPRGTPVLAAADGKIVKLFDSKPGGLTIYEFDPTETLVYYYAHLDRYAAGIAAGVQVKQGEVLGYVGTTGNANPNAPHLHFAVFKLGPEKRWWQGTAINPYPMLAAKSNQ